MSLAVAVGEPTALSTATFLVAVDRPGLVLVDVHGSCCGPCRVFAPVFAGAARRHPDIVFATVDADAEPQLCEALGVRSVPTVLGFEDGHLLLRRSGVMPAAGLEELIDGLRAGRSVGPAPTLTDRSDPRG